MIVAILALLAAAPPRSCEEPDAGICALEFERCCGTIDGNGRAYVDGNTKLAGDFGILDPPLNHEQIPRPADDSREDQVADGLVEVLELQLDGVLLIRINPNLGRILNRRKCDWR